MANKPSNLDNLINIINLVKDNELITGDKNTIISSILFNTSLTNDTIKFIKDNVIDAKDKKIITKKIKNKRLNQRRRETSKTTKTSKPPKQHKPKDIITKLQDIINNTNDNQTHQINQIVYYCRDVLFSNDYNSPYREITTHLLKSYYLFYLKQSISDEEASELIFKYQVIKDNILDDIITQLREEAKEGHFLISDNEVDIETTNLLYSFMMIDLTHSSIDISHYNKMIDYYVSNNKLPSHPLFPQEVKDNIINKIKY